MWSDNPTARELSDDVPAVITASWTDGMVFLNYSWDGSESSDWQDLTNWTPEKIPTYADNVVIPNGMPNYPIINNGTTTAVCNNMTIESNASVTIATNGQMTVSGNITNNRGADGLIVKSDATGDGSLIVNNAVAATTERFVTGNKWHLMFPTLSAIPTSTYTTEGSNTNPNFYSYNEANEDYWDATTIYGTTGWTSEVGAGTIRTDKGYLFNRNLLADKTYVQTGGNIEIANKTFDVSYSISTVVIENGVTNSRDHFDGWNLAGNPYTSAIDWNLVNLNGIESGVYYYDVLNYKYYLQGGNGSQNPPYDEEITLNGGSRFIPSGQGFMTKVINTGTSHNTSFTIPASARVHNNQAYYKNISSIPNLLKLQVEKNGYTDQLIVRTLPSDVTTEHDAKYDAYKMFAWDNTKPQIYSLSNDFSVKYAINSLPEINTNQIIPIGIYIGESGKYTFNIIENNFEGIDIFLHDSELNSLTLLNENSQYTFSSISGIFEKRFELIFESYSNISSVFRGKVNIFPNPNKGNFYINLKNIKYEKVDIKISDISGKIIFEKTFNKNGLIELQLRNKIPGIYFIKILLDNKIYKNAKIVIQ